MKVNVEETGLATLYAALKKNKRVEVEFLGNTLGELIDAMVKQYGGSVKKALLDDKGDLDTEIRILLNGSTYLDGSRKEISLNEGDTLSFRALS